MLNSLPSKGLLFVAGSIVLVGVENSHVSSWPMGFVHPRIRPEVCSLLILTQATGLKEQFLPSFAERFQSAGFGVLLYDHRNWGESDGLPRNETDPIQQSRDFSQAFNFATSLELVDATKIVFWGSSMAGGAVLHAAAFDKRIRAVISQVPFVSGEAISPMLAPHIERIYTSRENVGKQSSSSLLKLFPGKSEIALQGDPSSVMNDPNLHQFLKSLEERNIPWDPNATPQTLLNIVAFEPLAFIHRIAPTPLLFIAADRDAAAGTSLQLKAYAHAWEPKTLVVLRNTGHFDPYHGESFEENVRAQLSFLNSIF